MVILVTINSGADLNVSEKDTCNECMHVEDAMCIFIYVLYSQDLCSLQAAVEASNALLALEVSRFQEKKRHLLEDMRVRRARYAMLFGRPPNFTSTGERKGE